MLTSVLACSVLLLTCAIVFDDDSEVLWTYIDEPSHGFYVHGSESELPLRTSDIIIGRNGHSERKLLVGVRQTEWHQIRDFITYRQRH